MDVGDWLCSLGLERYEQAFRDNEIDLDLLPNLTGDDLKDLGVYLVGHRRRLLDAIARLRDATRRSEAAAATGAIEPLLRARSASTAEAAVDLHRALEITRQQGARSLELRAARDLARLWAEQGDRQRAHDLLAPVYGWFTEGFDTADLRDSKALLDESG